MKTQVEENTKDSSRSLLIKNLDRSISAKEFFRMFEEFGEVKSSKLEVDENGVSKNYGYIFFSDVKSAETAKQTLVKI
jgi:RNA recognition motif-containing protein